MMNMESKKGVPFDFFSKYATTPTATTVGELIQQLGRLPRDLSLGDDGEWVSVSVYNIETGPFVSIEIEET